MDNFGYNPYSRDIQWEDAEDLQNKADKLEQAVEILLDIGGDDCLTAAAYAYVVGHWLETFGRMGGEWLDRQKGEDN